MDITMWAVRQISIVFTFKDPDNSIIYTYPDTLQIAFDS